MTKNVLLTAGRVLLGISLLAYLGRSGLLDWTALLRLGAEWPAGSAALALLAGVVLLTSWRLQTFVRARGRHLPLGASVRLTLIGAFFNALLPGTVGGDAVRMYYAATSNRQRGTEIATLVLVDRIVGVLALLTLPLLIAPLFLDVIRSTTWLRSLLMLTGLLAALLWAGTLLVLRDGAASRWLRTALGRRGRLGAHARRAIDTVRALRHSPATLLTAFGISLMIQASMVAVMVLLLTVTSGSVPPASVAVLVPLGFLVNSLPITPGGLGVGEVAFAVLLAPLGAEGGAEALLAWRVLTTLIDLGGAVLYLAGRTDMPTRALEVSTFRNSQG